MSALGTDTSFRVGLAWTRRALVPAPTVVPDFVGFHVAVPLSLPLSHDLLPYLQFLGATPAARLEALRYLCQVLGLEQIIAHSVAVMQGALTLDLYQMHWDVWSRWCRARVLSPFAMSVPLLPLFFRHLFEELG